MMRKSPAGQPVGSVKMPDTLQGILICISLAPALSQCLHFVSSCT